MELARDRYRLKRFSSIAEGSQVTVDPSYCWRYSGSAAHAGMNRYVDASMSANRTVLAFGAVEDLLSIFLELLQSLSSTEGHPLARN
jgi:hypothetical protein